MGLYGAVAVATLAAALMPTGKCLLLVDVLIGTCEFIGVAEVATGAGACVLVAAPAAVMA